MPAHRLLRQKSVPQISGLVLALLMFSSTAGAAQAVSRETQPQRQATNNVHAAGDSAGGLPNILFFILDDVGIDQMELYGYGGDSPPRLPNITAIANAGLKFTNFWAMPECSPSRALVFEGRYPLRTHVTDAILSVDLANSQVSPYESTTPRILREANYTSGLFGKFHLTGSNVNPENNPLGYTAVYQLGWDYFAGWQDGAPHPIDATAGGVDPSGPYTCGFIPNTGAAGGADAGACYFVDQTCTEITVADAPTPGLACLEQGGLFEPNSSCEAQVPANLDFTLQNGYYAGELVINEPDGSAQVFAPDDPSGAARGYRSVIESDRAIDWINRQGSVRPWMATVSFSSAHTPYQQAPAALLPPVSIPAGGLNCVDVDDVRVISNQMIEAMDTEIGRVLVETGVASLNSNGELVYEPGQSNTMIVILGDNGTYAPVVKGPFNPERSKGTVYQTGVWTPLIVAGPLVVAPGRTVDAMANIADVFELFGEMAGLRVHQLVPKSRRLDSVSMLPYLTNPEQQSLRRNNFAALSGNIQVEGTSVQPCVLASVNSCVQLFPSQALCESEGGVWWGDQDGSAPPPAGAPQDDCCGVNQYLSEQGLNTYDVLPDSQLALRDDDYKLVRTVTTNWNATDSSCETVDATEFYAIDENVPPKLDNKLDNLLLPPHQLGPEERKSYKKLNKQLDRLLWTVVDCVGDGNLDGVVDSADLEQHDNWVQAANAYSSWYDFNFDGFTDDLDIPPITDGKFPRTCPRHQDP